MIEIKPDIKGFTWAFYRMLSDMRWQALRFRFEADYGREFAAIEKAMR